MRKPIREKPLTKPIAREIVLKKLIPVFSCNLLNIHQTSQDKMEIGNSQRLNIK